MNKNEYNIIENQITRKLRHRITEDTSRGDYASADILTKRLKQVRKDLKRVWADAEGQI